MRRITALVRSMRRDKLFKLGMTAMLFVGFVMGVWFPHLVLFIQVHGLFTSMIWLWEA
jgi:hypothetical protein